MGEAARGPRRGGRGEPSGRGSAGGDDRPPRSWRRHDGGQAGACPRGHVVGVGGTKAEPLPLPSIEVCVAPLGLACATQCVAKTQQKLDLSEVWGPSFACTMGRHTLPTSDVWVAWLSNAPCATTCVRSPNARMSARPTSLIQIVYLGPIIKLSPLWVSLGISERATTMHRHDRQPCPQCKSGHPARSDHPEPAVSRSHQSEHPMANTHFAPERRFGHSEANMRTWDLYTSLCGVYLGPKSDGVAEVAIARRALWLVRSRSRCQAWSKLYISSERARRPRRALLRWTS